MHFSFSWLLFAAACCYTFCLPSAVFLRYGWLTRLLLPGGLVLHLIFVAYRYRHAWPMAPLHEGVFFLPFFLGCFSFFVIGKHSFEEIRKPFGMVLLMLSLFTWAGVFFPKDYYLPFIQTRTIFSHLFFLFGSAGKACFFVAAAHGIILIISQKTIDKDNGAFILQRMHRWAVWSFALWTFSIFSGAVWSYLGWGSPVVWDDPAIATAMGTWMFLSLYLHLHLTTFRGMRSRAVMTTAGALWILIFNWLPELGQWTLPKLL